MSCVGCLSSEVSCLFIEKFFFKLKRVFFDIFLIFFSLFFKTRRDRFFYNFWENAGKIEKKCARRGSISRIFILGI